MVITQQNMWRVFIQKLICFKGGHRMCIRTDTLHVVDEKSCNVLQNLQKSLTIVNCAVNYVVRAKNALIVFLLISLHRMNQSG